MKEKNKGALPYQRIEKLIEEGSIKNATVENVQPASLDLTLDSVIYRLHSIFLPTTNETVEELISLVGATKYSFDYPLEVDVPYLVKLKEELQLPKNIYAYANPKSSVGRIDVSVNMVADRIPRFDSAGVKGYKGTLWVLIRPRSFPIKVSPGNRLLQVRFFNEDTRLSQKELEKFYRVCQPIYNYRGEPLEFERMKISDRDGGLILTVDLRREIVGWRCEPRQNILDFSKIGFYKPEEFFEPIKKPRNGVLRLRKGDFYIFYSRQWVRVPPRYAVEMVPVDIRTGEYRSHYAGFNDPGFGYGKNGSVKGRPLVLEVRTYEDNIILRDNQPIAKVIYEKVAETPKRVYGETNSHYAEQTGPRLSKHFKEDRSQKTV